MANLEEIKNIIERELKKYNKNIKDISDKFKKISNEHELLLLDVAALDRRLIRVEKKLKTSNNNSDDEDDEDYKLPHNNNKNISDFRYQIITRAKAKQLENNKKLNQSNENKNQNNNINNKAISNEKRFHENNKKNIKKNKKEREKNEKINLTNKNYENDKDNFNNFDDRLEKTFNVKNSSLMQNSLNQESNNENDENESTEIMSFKNKNMNIKESESVISKSEHFSEFSFNPQKRRKDFFNNQSQQEKMDKIQKQLSDVKTIINSEIIKSFQELDLIIKHFPNYNKFDDNPFFQPIFQSSFNGDSAKKFHQFCDGEPSLILFIETDKGNRFGGFTSIGFNSDGEAKKDFYAFLFSFDLMKVYKNKKGKTAIFCKESSGPCFGDKDSQDLEISDKFLTNESYVGNANGCFLNMNADYEINKGNSNFIVNKLEIFKLLI